MQKCIKKLYLYLKSKIHCTVFRASHYFSHLNDKLLGVDFDLREKSVVEHGASYEATTWLAFFNLKRYLKKCCLRGVSIADIGCGKGKMLYFFSQFPFKNIDGIEYSCEYADAARINMKKLERKGKADSKRVHVITGDASYYKDYHKYQMFYLYNPFDEVIMKAFIDNLLEDVRNHPRDIRIIYCNPRCHKLLLEKGFIVECEFYYRTKVYLLRNV